MDFQDTLERCHAELLSTARVNALYNWQTRLCVPGDFKIHPERHTVLR